jgi:Xaa-Pro aminopeptidase
MENRSIYQKRRQALTNRFTKTLFVIPSGREANRSHSVRYRFKVAADFFYLTGLQISEAVLVITANQTILFQNQHVDHVWGEFTELTAQDQLKLQGVQCEDIKNLEKILSDLTKDTERLAFAFGRDQGAEDLVQKQIAFQSRAARARGTVLSLCDSRTMVGAIRAIKDESEIADLRQAAQRSSQVHQLLMKQDLIGRSEREISNWIEGQFLLQNMQWCSYETIVGAGHRSTVLHARATDQVIQKGEMVLIDAGAEWQGYCADITRALPSGKTFSAEQKFVYNIVLEAQKQAIAMVKPGITLQQIHRHVIQVMGESLNQTADEMKKLMPHSTSHWIGLDVHDPCAYVDDQGREIKLQAGMTFTVEPGLYFNKVQGFENYEGIGVRIEDDVVVTNNGCEVLTSVQKEIDEIEQLRSSAIISN